MPRGVLHALLRTVCVAWLTASCSLLVNDDVSHVRCSEDGHIGPPACDPGEICAAGRCRACARRDTCGDEIDNDCNGRIDDECPDAAVSGASGT